MDYGTYRLTVRESLICAAISVGIGLLLAVLFYRSVFAVFFCLPVYPIVRRNMQKFCKNRKKARLLEGFRAMMQSVSAALLAGYSMENAFREAERELAEMLGETAPMVLELRQINAGVSLNHPFEQMLSDFGRRSGCEDIENFAEIFSFAKRGGGDFVGIIRTTANRLNDKWEVEREIETVISGKKFEGRIMNVMPAFLLGYLNVTSEGYLSPLYGNPLGMLIMTGVVCVWLAAFLWTEKLLEIVI